MMVAGGIRDSTQQPQASAEDEALKRNTDCVYFLASPLTCKKGSDCEYRHSEYARVNPRDCWYWLNGNCMNPKCAFRHPPLDGLLGTQAATSVGSSLPTTQTPAAASAVTATNAPYNSGKQAVPCIFFQKGLCLKGDRCAFSHGPIPISNKAPHVPAAAPGSEPPNPNKVFGSLEKCNQEQKLLQANMSKSIEQPLTAKPGVRQETALPKSVNATGKSIPGPTKIKDEVSIHNVTGVAPITNGSSMIRSNRPNQNDVSDDQSFQNGKDADEFYRESSPGFDVLVDDELRDSDYYRDDDQFGRVHEQRDLDDFDVGRSAGYHSLADVDRQMFQDPHGYDSYERMQGQYAWDQRRASSERLLAGSDPLERRGYHKTESPDQINESDLRYRLSKQRRVNGLRSVISHDYAPDKDDKERSHRSSRRDSRHSSLHESSLSSRLRGRIKIPGRSSPPNGYDIPAEREMDRGRNLGRLSPGRTQSSSHQGRLRDRIKGRVPEDFSSEERNFRGPRMTRDIMNERSFHFTGPKSLAELKVNKTAEGKEQQVNRPEFFSLGKRKNLEDHQPSECNLSFEGPKPLSEILKRKRRAEISVSGSGPLSSNNESKESLMGSSDTLSVTEMHNVCSSASEKEANLHVLEAKEDFKYLKADRVGKAVGLSPSSKSELEHGQFSQVQNVDELETEEGMIVDEGTEDQEFEAYDQRDGDFDYEQVDGGEYNIGEGENADAEEEYPDDEEDGDDFAKKIGVMFS